MARIAIFDVNETMLDLGGLDAAFREIFDDPLARREWFARLLHLSTVATVLGAESDFGALGAAALDATGVSRGVTIERPQRDALAGALADLSAHPDVAPALDTLRRAGWRLFALTNSPGSAAAAQLASAGVADRFDDVFSVEAAGRFKPAPEPYRVAAETIGVAESELWMVACHDWDLAGARAVGMRTAYVERPGMAFASIYAAPTLRAPDMEALAEHLVGREL